MKNVLKRAGIIFLLTVFLMSTTGFSLIHHICHACGEQQTHFSFINIFNDAACKEHDSKHLEAINHSGCNHKSDLCQKNHDNQSHNANCCKNDNEFFKIISPFEHGDSWFSLQTNHADFMVSEVLFIKNEPVYLSLHFFNYKYPFSAINTTDINTFISCFII